MSITLEPNKGLRLDLDRYSPICTWHGGGNFWSHEFQLTIRQSSLATFLPRAIEGDGSVLFEHRVGGVEVASTSTAITSISQVPASELQALRKALEELKRKAEDPHCDRTKRQMIEGFRLPDPQKDRDLYRLIGKGSQQKLIVLWGVEREEGSALAPLAAVDLMHTPQAEVASSTSRGRFWFVLFTLVCLAAWAIGGLYLWQQEKLREQLQAATPPALFFKHVAPTAQPDSMAVNPATEPAPPAPDQSATPTVVAPSDIPTTTLENAKPTADDATKSSAIKKADSETTGANKTASADIAKSSNTTKTTTGTTSSTGTAVAPTAAVKDGSGKVPAPTSTNQLGATTNTGSRTSDKHATSTKDLRGSVPTPGADVASTSAAKDGSGKVPAPTSTNQLGTTTSTGSRTSDKHGTSTKDLRGSGSTPGAAVTPTATVKDGSGKVPTPTSTNQLGTTTSTGSRTFDNKVTATDVIKSDVASASATTLMTPNGPPPAGVSSLNIVSTSLSKLLDNGNVEVLLNIVARNIEGVVGDAPPISEWRVDNVVQKKPDGSRAEGPVLPLRLSAGKHAITTIGRGADGKPYQTDATVLITPKD